MLVVINTSKLATHKQPVLSVWLLQKTLGKIVQKNNHSMKLEEQGISKEQMKQQEDDVYKKILNDDSMKIWAHKDEI